MHKQLKDQVIFFVSELQQLKTELFAALQDLNRHQVLSVMGKHAKTFGAQENQEDAIYVQQTRSLYEIVYQDVGLVMLEKKKSPL